MSPWKLGLLWLGLGFCLTCGGVQRPDGGVGLLNAGSYVSALRGLDQHGARVNLEFPSPQLTVVYFYPKDATPGCTKQACAFRDVWHEYERQHVRVIGVSNDDVDSHREFAEEYRLPFPLVADQNGAWAQTFGVPRVAGIYSRVSFLVGHDGRVLRTYRDIDPGIHAREILRDAANYTPLPSRVQPAPSLPNDRLLAPAPRLKANEELSVHLSLHIGTMSAAESDLWLAVELIPPPGAHLYWKFPGEAGLATRIDVHAPPGLMVGPIQYPGPTRLVGETGRISFGYRGATVLLAKVTPNPELHAPRDANNTAATLQVHGSWLSCDSRCVKEETRQSITWNQPPKPIPQLGEWLSRIPQNGQVLGFRGVMTPGSRAVQLTAPEPWQIEDAFPEQDVAPGKRSPTLISDANGVRLQPLASPTPSTLVVRAKGDQGELGFFTVSVMSE